MRFVVMTLFPAAFDSLLGTSLFGKAIDAGRLEVESIDIRDFSEGKHRVVDDSPYGGGAGMVMKVDPVSRAIASARAKHPGLHVALLTPQGRSLDQAHVARLAQHESLGLVCGRYEGVDERVRSYVDEELSVGDFVLSGGEPAAWIVMDAVSRLVPGVLGCGESTVEESFSLQGMLEYPQYTRPREFEGRTVPEVLLSGDHGVIARWRKRQALLRTASKRPDLLELLDLDDEMRIWLAEEGLKKNED